MSIQSALMGNRTLTNFVMSRIPPAKHVARGEKRALEVTDITLTRTNAYPHFISEQGIDDRAPKSMAAFRELPLTDKSAYVDRFDLRDLCLDGRVTSAYTIEKSSGHGGGSYYWLRLPQEDELFPKYLEYAFLQFYGMDKKATLVLITLALGTWTSGEKMAQALREVAASGKYPLTVMAPGTNPEEILEIVADLGHHYDQVVMVGYPPFLKTVIDEGDRRGIDWRSLSVKLGLGGEGYSEQWREHVASLLGIDSRKDLLAISGGYGAADVGMTIGREYPLTVLIRKLCLDDTQLAEALFQDGSARTGNLPGLLQYNPATCYVESIDRELVFTVLSGIPLVRYNIHDTGGVLPFEQVMDVMRDHGYDAIARLQSIGYGREQIWRLPFFYVYGRSDGTVSIVGANVFPQNVQAVLSEARDRLINTFYLSVLTTKSYSQQLTIALEHHSDTLSESEIGTLGAHYHNLLVSGLRKLNQDFRDAHDDNPESADPIVTVHPRGSGPFADTEKSIKNHYVS